MTDCKTKLGFNTVIDDEGKPMVIPATEVLQKMKRREEALFDLKQLAATRGEETIPFQDFK